MTCEWCPAEIHQGQPTDHYEGCPYEVAKRTGRIGGVASRVYWDGLEALVRDPGAGAAAAELERQHRREDRLDAEQ